VSSVPATPEVPPRASAGTLAWSLPSKAAAGLSGTPGLVLKIALLSVMNGLAVWAAAVLAQDRKWIAVTVLVVATLAINAAYFSRRALPLKFLIPGVLLMLAFQFVPIVYLVDISLTKYATGHILTKTEAIASIKSNSLSPPANGKAYLMAPARDDSGKLVLLLVDEDSGATFVGTRESLKPLAKDDVTAGADGITGATGYTLVKGNELFTLDRQLSSYTIPTSGSAAIRPEGLDSAVELQPSLRFDKQGDRFVRIADGVVFKDNHKGSYIAASGEELEPGWKANVGFDNFSRIIHSPLIRKPFLRVFVWTFVFAALAVLLSFAMGLFLAVALDKQGMRFQKMYRSLLIMPYAIPGFLSLLVWQGLLNDDFGVVNRVFHTNIPWLFDGTWAKVSVIMVSIWLTFPYFFLVSMGALQSIPSELREAARVDGGGAWQVFRKVTLPLLLIVVGPLIIASFAFNFNNFGNIYLLTGGGPATNDQTTAGATDILISYTYKLAFASGKGQDYGLAAAIALIIFFIVASISAFTFWKSKALESVQ
jgi:arabinogalactan oligomer/maltooligosaccharide transport system permease protein